VALFERCHRDPRILSVIGARPEIMQAAPVSAALADLADEILVHTGQHYDVAMSEAPYPRDAPPAAAPQPRRRLAAARRQLAIGQDRLAEIIDLERPDVVVVRGDTNATLSGARAAVAAGVPLVHVEAGLRSYRDDMPEEAQPHRDRPALRPAPGATPGRRANLIAEGVAGRVEVTGDPPVRHALSARRAEIVPAEGEYLLAYGAPQLQHRRSRAPAARPGLPGPLALARDLPRTSPHPRRAGDVEADRAGQHRSQSTPSTTRACSSSSAARR
jgi:hypothetical protein